MIDRILKARINEYAPANLVDQDNALQEILQCYVLASLAKAGFFRIAEFHGGTCLRIVHQIDRFSEDLDFVLKKIRSKFYLHGFHALGHPGL